MGVALREALREAVEQFGRGLIADPSRLRGVLGDLAPPATPAARAELDLVVTAATVGVPSDLLAGKPPADLSARLAHAAQADVPAAATAVDAWAFALGLPTQQPAPPIIAAPPPPSNPSPQAPPPPQAPPTHAAYPQYPTDPTYPPDPNPGAWTGQRPEPPTPPLGPVDTVQGLDRNRAPRGRRFALVAVAAVAVILVAVVGVTVLVGDGAAEAEPCGPSDPGRCIPSNSARSVKLRASCADGRLAACDELEMVSPILSDQAQFAKTCGDTTEGRARCSAGGEAADSIAAEERRQGASDSEAACVGYHVWKDSLDNDTTIEELDANESAISRSWRSEPSLSGAFTEADRICGTTAPTDYHTTEHVLAKVPDGWTVKVDPDEEESFSLIAADELSNIIVAVYPTTETSSQSYATTTRAELSSGLEGFTEESFTEAPGLGCADAMRIGFSWTPDGGDRVFQEQRYCVDPDRGIVIQTTVTATTTAGRARVMPYVGDITLR